MNPFDLSWMVGRRVTVTFFEPSLWCFSFGDSGINVGCPWRLLKSGRIAVSGEDHQQKFGLPVPFDAMQWASSLLENAVVRQVELLEGTADLFIDFDDNLRLEIVPFSSGYESWQMSAPNGEYFVAQGGGCVAKPNIK